MCSCRPPIPMTVTLFAMPLTSTHSSFSLACPVIWSCRYDCLFSSSTKPRLLCCPLSALPVIYLLQARFHVTGLDIGLVGPVARGASRFENLLAPKKTYWPPKKLTGPYLKTKLARRKTICINLQFAHRPIIKLFRSHPGNIFEI